MKFYVLKVKEEGEPVHYIVHNAYVGYLNKYEGRSFQVFAEGEFPNHSPDEQYLHMLFCGRYELSKEEAKGLVDKHRQLELSGDNTWYEVYFPNPKKSSVSYLRGVKDKSKTIK